MTTVVTVPGLRQGSSVSVPMRLGVALLDVVLTRASYLLRPREHSFSNFGFRAPLRGEGESLWRGAHRSLQHRLLGSAVR
jgi:hypothetical protein